MTSDFDNLNDYATFMQSNVKFFAALIPLQLSHCRLSTDDFTHSASALSLQFNINLLNDVNNVKKSQTYNCISCKFFQMYHSRVANYSLRNASQRA